MGAPRNEEHIRTLGRSQVGCFKEKRTGSISLFGGLEPPRTYGSLDSFTGFIAKRKQASRTPNASRMNDVAVPVGGSMFEGAPEPRGSVWSARSLLPLWPLGRQRCSLRGSIPATQKVSC